MDSQFVFDRDLYLKSGIPARLAEPIAACLYVMRCEHFIKVGISSDVARRLAGLQGANPFPVKLGTKFRFADRQYAALAERACHSLFASTQVFGEWFNVEYDVAVPLVREVVAATRLLPAIHKAIERQRAEAIRTRYETDQNYRDHVDQRDRENHERYQYLVAKEKALEAAGREFEESTRSWRKL